MTKHYVRFHVPGTFFVDFYDEEIESRDVDFKIRGGADAYHFYDRDELEIDGQKFLGEIRNESEVYYLKDKI